MYAFTASFLGSCCEIEDSSPTVNRNSNEIVFRHSSPRDTVESLHWDGDIEHDCENPGTKCVVIRPKTAKIATDFLHAVNTLDYVAFFNSPEGEQIPLIQEVKNKIISGEMIVYPKEKVGENAIQFRIK
ncbi:MAG: hypothetical protein NZM43_06190 [Saprospiraceae bacterium]|nr:hypothetical protein [Saprospiraceae bacterium]MDW8483900.1 hypothetical protein [Saprospiraceae bacterium]